MKSYPCWFSVLMRGGVILAFVFVVALPAQADVSIDYDNESECFGDDLYDLGWEGDAGNASVIDVDGDGDKDLLISFFEFDNYPDTPSGMAWMRYGVVNDAPWYFNTQTDWFSGGIRPSVNTFGFLSADFDNDGDLDVYCPNPYGATLYENRNGVLTNVTSASSALMTINSTISGVWADVDGDTFVDLVILKCNQAQRLYWRLYSSNEQYILLNKPNPAYFAGSNLPQRIFELQIPPLISGTDYIGCALSADFDGDHDVDLIFMNASHNTSIEPRYYENRINADGTFSDQTYAKLNSVMGDSIWADWGTIGSVVDVDNNGTLDIFYASQYISGYVLNDGNGVMSPPPPSFDGNTAQHLADLGVLDIDLDGRFDIIRTRDGSADHAQVLKNTLSGGDIVLTDVSGAVGLGDPADAVGAYGLCLADVTSDGLTEVYYCRDDEHFQYFPRLVLGTKNWITVSPRSPAGFDNYYCIGATVQVDDGTTVRTRVVDGGSSRASQQDLDLVFGLGDHSGPVDVTVTLPSGRTRVYHDLPVNQSHDLDMDDDLLVAGSVDLSVIYHVEAGYQDWVLTWKTNYETQPSQDTVTLSVVLGDPFETTGFHTLANPLTVVGGTVITDAGNGQYLHTYTLENILCTTPRRVVGTAKTQVGAYSMTDSDTYYNRICVQQF